MTTISKAYCDALGLECYEDSVWRSRELYEEIIFGGEAGDVAEHEEEGRGETTEIINHAIRTTVGKEGQIWNDVIEIVQEMKKWADVQPDMLTPFMEKTLFNSGIERCGTVFAPLTQKPTKISRYPTEINQKVRETVSNIQFDGKEIPAKMQLFLPSFQSMDSQYKEYEYFVERWNLHLPFPDELKPLDDLEEPLHFLPKEVYPEHDEPTHFSIITAAEKSICSRFILPEAMESENRPTKQIEVASVS